MGGDNLSVLSNEQQASPNGRDPASSDQIGGITGARVQLKFFWPNNLQMHNSMTFVPSGKCH